MSEREQTEIILAVHELYWDSWLHGNWKCRCGLSYGNADRDAASLAHRDHLTDELSRQP